MTGVVSGAVPCASSSRPPPTEGREARLPREALVPIRDGAHSVCAVRRRPGGSHADVSRSRVSAVGTSRPGQGRLTWSTSCNWSLQPTLRQLSAGPSGVPTQNLRRGCDQA